MPKDSNTSINYRNEPFFEAPLHRFESDPRPAPTLSLGNIAKRYNLRSMSPRAMVELSNDLFSSGHLTKDQYELLSFQPELMPNFDVTIGALTGEQADPDRPRDYTEIWRQRLAFESKYAENAERIIIRTQKILDLLETIEKQPKIPRALTKIGISVDRPIKLPIKLPPLGFKAK
tara:strand:- start:584 stop:1108 length:525 start_codon:yes stop_codon:yes gene_type:complete